MYLKSKLIKLFFLAALTIILSYQTLPAIAESYEKPPMLSASAVRPTSLQKGKHHQLGPNVKNDGYMNHYDLNSDFGSFQVRGYYFLVKRISEIEALNYLKENYPSGDVAVDAAVKTGEAIVTAPVKGAKKLYNTVSDTDKLSSTAKKIPGGVVNLFGMAADTVVSAADYAYDTGKSIVKNDGSSDTGDKLSKGLTVAQDFALDYIGYSDAYRELAKSLQVDPYSENEVLHGELRRVASIKASVHVGSKFVPSLYSIPGVGAANKYLDYAEKTATYQDPKEVDELSGKILHTLGKDDAEITKVSIDALMENQSYSPPMRNEIALALQSMKDVKGISSLVKASARAGSREIAHFYVQTIDKIAALHKTKGGIQKIVTDEVLPAALGKDNVLYIPLAVDYVVWTPEVEKIFLDLKKSAEAQAKGVKAQLIVAGTVSEKAKEKLMSLGATQIFESQNF